MIHFCYPDSDQRFLNWIRIRPNDTDPTGSGSETLVIETIIGWELGRSIQTLRNLLKFFKNGTIIVVGLVLPVPGSHVAVALGDGAVHGKVTVLPKHKNYLKVVNLSESTFSFI